MDNMIKCNITGRKKNCLYYATKKFGSEEKAIKEYVSKEGKILIKNGYKEDYIKQLNDVDYNNLLNKLRDNNKYIPKKVNKEKKVEKVKVPRIVYKGNNSVSRVYGCAVNNKEEFEKELLKSKNEKFELNVC